MSCAPAHADELLKTIVAAGYPDAKLIGHVTDGKPGPCGMRLSLFLGTHTATTEKKLDCAFHEVTAHCLTQSRISSSVGKRPTAFFENMSRLSTLISKTPPVDGRRFIFAEGRNSVIRSRAARARGS